MRPDSNRYSAHSVVERGADALNKCRIVPDDPASILFAIEKAGAQQLISTEVSRHASY